MRLKLASTLTTLIVGIVMMFGSSALAVDCATCSGQTNLNTADAIACGSNCAAGTNQDSNKATGNVNNTFASVLNVLSMFVAAIAVIMVMIGGFRYITSAGKQETVAGAKNTLIYAAVGLVVVALAQVIVHYVLIKTNQAAK